MRHLTLSKIAVAAAALMLSGCLTSKSLLFTETNATATPLAAGVYEVCEVEKNGPPTDCQDVAVAHDAGGKYTFQVDEPGEGPTYGRFKSGVGRAAFAAQLWGEDDEGAFYFLAWREGASFSMSLIDCDALPAAWKDRYMTKGELEVSGSTCTVSTARAVLSAAKAFRKTDPAANGQRLVYAKKAA